MNRVSRARLLACAAGLTGFTPIAWAQATFEKVTFSSGSPSWPNGRVTRISGDARSIYFLTQTSQCCPIPYLWNERDGVAAPYYGPYYTTDGQSFIDSRTRSWGYRGNVIYADPEIDFYGIDETGLNVVGARRVPGVTQSTPVRFTRNETSFTSMNIGYVSQEGSASLISPNARYAAGARMWSGSLPIPFVWAEGQAPIDVPTTIEVRGLTDTGLFLGTYADPVAAAGEPVVWYYNGPILALPRPVGSMSSNLPESIDRSGTIVVGWYYDGTQQHGWVWTRRDDTRSFETLLTELGIPTAGYDFLLPQRISYDGRWIVGIYKQPTAFGVFRLRLPAPCDADCDGSSRSPGLDLNDFCSVQNLAHPSVKMVRTVWHGEATT